MDPLTFEKYNLESTYLVIEPTSNNFLRWKSDNQLFFAGSLDEALEGLNFYFTAIKICDCPLEIQKEYQILIDRLIEKGELEDVDIIEHLKPYRSHLLRAAERLFRNATPTTQFMRQLNQTIQGYAIIDIPSPDDFYSRHKNKEMTKVLNWLGYESTEFGICMKK